MAEIKIICPYCGKVSENHINCDHCGSMLVRLAARGIDAKELYEIFRGKGNDEGRKPFCFTDDFIFPALKAELTECYNLAKHLSKSLYLAPNPLKSYYSPQIIAGRLLNALYINIQCLPFQGDIYQLLTVIVTDDGRIDPFTKPSFEVKYLLDNLFIREVEGRKITYRCVCGTDIDGATRLMSYLLQKRAHLDETAPIVFETIIDGQWKKLSSEKCPVCGKDAHGEFSCEHCGSMLLQFERRGINYDTSILKATEPLGNLQSCIEEGLARCTSDNDATVKIDAKVIKTLSGRDDMQENLLDVMARISIEIKKEEKKNIYVALKRKNVDDVNNQTAEDVKPNFSKPLIEFVRRFKHANMFHTEFVQLSSKEYGFKVSTCCGEDVLMAAKFATGILKAYDDLNVLDNLTDLHFVTQSQPVENEPESQNEQAAGSSSVADNDKATSTQVAQPKTGPEATQPNVPQSTKKQPVKNNPVQKKPSQKSPSTNCYSAKEESSNPWKWVAIALIAVLIGGGAYLMHQNTSAEPSSAETNSAPVISDAADANYEEEQEFEDQEYEEEEYEEEGDADVPDQEYTNQDSPSMLASKQVDAPAQSNGEWWAGTIGGNTGIRMYINEETGEFWYHYTKYSSDNRMYLSVIENDEDHLVLLETNKKGLDTGKFDGYMSGNNYSGTFYNLLNGKTFGFTLTQQ